MLAGDEPGTFAKDVKPPQQGAGMGASAKSRQSWAAGLEEGEIVSVPESAFAPVSLSSQARQEREMQVSTNVGFSLL